MDVKLPVFMAFCWSRLGVGHASLRSRCSLDTKRCRHRSDGVERSARGNCYDNAIVESFFGLLKRERVNRVRYRTRDEARADVFDYIECFYNRKRRHGYLGNISPAAFEEGTLGLYETVH